MGEEMCCAGGVRDGVSVCVFVRAVARHSSLPPTAERPGPEARGPIELDADDRREV